MPLEDVPLGQNAHWEARLMGPDVMSYGLGSGESYVSDMTLMFFNDTNQYIVNMASGAKRLCVLFWTTMTTTVSCEREL